MSHKPGPLPDREFDFHFKGGRPAINLVATVGERWRRSFERLREPGDFGRWVAEAGLLPAAPPVSEADLDAARTLREAIYRVAKPDGREPDAGDIAEINRWAAKPPLSPILDAKAVSATWRAGNSVDVLSTLSRDAIDLFTGPLRDRIRECAADDCSLMFVDTSRPGRRRWCSMGACGNRTKTKAYRRRTKEATG